MGTDAEKSQAARSRMVERQLAGRGIEDERVLAAMATIPREEFVPRVSRREAYADRAVTLASGQTVSQPWIVAAILQALACEPGGEALEVGTGSGYSAAVLSLLAESVVSIERLPELADLARANLERVGIRNVEVICADGSVGLPDRAPFNAIAVHAATPSEPQQLLDQLAPGGRLVAPVSSMPERGGGYGDERLVRWERDPVAREGEDAVFRRRALAACRFVPLIGAAGYPQQ